MAVGRDASNVGICRRPRVGGDLGCGRDPASGARSTRGRIASRDFSRRGRALRHGGGIPPAGPLRPFGFARRGRAGPVLETGARRGLLQPARRPPVHGRLRRGRHRGRTVGGAHRDRHLPGARRPPRATPAPTARSGRLAGRQRHRGGGHPDRRRRERLERRTGHPRRRGGRAGRGGGSGVGRDRRHERHGRPRHEHGDGRARVAVRGDVRRCSARDSRRNRHDGSHCRGRPADHSHRVRRYDRRVFLRVVVPIHSQDRSRPRDGVEHLVRDVGRALRVESAARCSRAAGARRMRRGERGGGDDHSFRPRPTGDRLERRSPRARPRHPPSRRSARPAGRAGRASRRCALRR